MSMLPKQVADLSIKLDKFKVMDTPTLYINTNRIEVENKYRTKLAIQCIHKVVNSFLGFRKMVTGQLVLLNESLKKGNIEDIAKSIANNISTKYVVQIEEKLIRLRVADILSVSDYLIIDEKQYDIQGIAMDYSHPDKYVFTIEYWDDDKIDEVEYSFTEYKGFPLTNDTYTKLNTVTEYIDIASSAVINIDKQAKSEFSELLESKLQEMNGDDKRITNSNPNEVVTGGIDRPLGFFAIKKKPVLVLRNTGVEPSSIHDMSTYILDSLISTVNYSGIINTCEAWSCVSYMDRSTVIIPKKSGYVFYTKFHNGGPKLSRPDENEVYDIYSAKVDMTILLNRNEEPTEVMIDFELMDKKDVLSDSEILTSYAINIKDAKTINDIVLTPSFIDSLEALIKEGTNISTNPISHYSANQVMDQVHALYIKQEMDNLQDYIIN